MTSTAGGPPLRPAPPASLPVQRPRHLRRGRPCVRPPSRPRPTPTPPFRFCPDYPACPGNTPTRVPPNSPSARITPLVRPSPRPNPRQARPLPGQPRLSGQGAVCGAACGPGRGKGGKVRYMATCHIHFAEAVPYCGKCKLRPGGGRGRGALATVYLFWGGAGAGALLVCALVDLLWLHEPFGIERAARGLSHWPVERLLGLALLAGWLMVACGVVCLAFDLGRIDRLISLLISPPVSLMNWGAWGLALLLAVGGALVAVRFLCLPWAARGLVTALEVLAAALALFVVAYTGFLLQALAGVRFWGLWPVVLLFVLSALSCGIAVPLLLCAVVPSDEVVESLSGGLLRVDFAVIVTESLTAAVLVAVAAASDHPGIQTSLSLLLRGDAALWWWAFAACGLVIPAAVELLALCSSSGETARRAALCAAAVILAGGVSLRIAIVDAGAFRALELGASPQGEAVAPVAPGPDSSGEGAADYEPKPADAFPFSLQ